MKTAHQQFNNNQTAGFPRTSPAHQRAKGQAKPKNDDWYAESTIKARKDLISEVLKSRGWVGGSDGVSYISDLGYVVRLETERYRYLEVFSNGKVVCDVDMRGFNPQCVNVYIDKLEEKINSK